MPNGFQTWKDILEVLVIPIALAFIAYAYPEIQTASRRQKFLKLIVRELRELNPHPEEYEAGLEWWDHQVKNFIHKRIFESPSQNRDFILSLPPDIVYNVSQLWDALEAHKETQWLHFLREITHSLYDETGEIQTAYEEWKCLLKQYESTKNGKTNISTVPQSLIDQT